MGVTEYTLPLSSLTPSPQSFATRLNRKGKGKFLYMQIFYGLFYIRIQKKEIVILSPCDRKREAPVNTGNPMCRLEPYTFQGFHSRGYK